LNKTDEIANDQVVGKITSVKYAYPKGNAMEINEEKINEVVVALLYLNFHGSDGVIRAWKSFD
jgi:hypothetical protein